MSYSSTVLEDSPRLYLRLGEASGTEAKDTSGNALTATYGNAPTLGVTGALVEDPSTAVTFNGTNQYISRTHNALLNVGDVFTYEAWVKRSANGRQDVILYKEGTPKTAKLAITAANKLQLRIPGVKTIAESTIELLADGLWHHLVATKNGATVKLYIDAVDRTGTVTNETCGNNEATLIIGAENTTEEFLKGSLDEVAIYPTALSKARIEAHYFAGKPMAQIAPSTTGLETSASAALRAKTTFALSTSPLQTAASAVLTAKTGIAPGAMGLQTSASATLTGGRPIVPGSTGLQTSSSGTLTAKTGLSPTPITLQTGTLLGLTAKTGLSPGNMALSTSASALLTAQTKISPFSTGLRTTVVAAVTRPISLGTLSIIFTTNATAVVRVRTNLSLSPVTLLTTASATVTHPLKPGIYVRVENLWKRLA